MKSLKLVLGLATTLFSFWSYSADLNPESLLQKTTCDKNTVVTLIGEVHDSVSSIQVSNHIMSLANEKFVYYSNESILTNDHSWAGNVFGIEEPIPYVASLVMLAESVLKLFQKDTYEQLQLSTDGSRLAISNSIKSLMTAVSFDEAKMLFDPHSQAVQILLDTKRNSDQPIQDILQVSKIKSLSLQEWYIFAASFSEKLNTRLMDMYPTVLNETNVHLMKGSGRNILFAKNILDKYCEASMSGKVMFIQMGQGHVEGVAKLLRFYLPSSAKVRVLSTQELASTYNSFRDRVEQNGFLNDYKAVVQDDPASLDYSPLGTPSVHIWAKQQLTKKQIKELEYLAKKRGLVVYDSGAIVLSELPIFSEVPTAK